MSVEGSASRADLIKKFRTHEKDSGSPEVQIALMTSRLDNMTEHFKTHAQDSHSQRGMQKLITRRKKLLQYLKDEAPARYRSLISALGLRK